MRTNIVRVTWRDHGVADVTASLLANDAQQVANHPGLEQHVIVKEKAIGARRAIQQELALLRHAAARKIAVDDEFLATLLEEPAQGLDAGLAFHRPVRLIGNDDLDIDRKSGV